MLTHTTKWSHPPGNAVVPSPWQATPSVAPAHVEPPTGRCCDRQVRLPGDAPPAAARRLFGPVTTLVQPRLAGVLERRDPSHVVRGGRPGTRNRIDKLPRVNH